MTNNDSSSQISSDNILSLFAANLWVMLTLDSPKVRYERFMESCRPALKTFIESIFLYDQVVVPTHDYLSLTTLVGILGEKAILELVNENHLKFIRVKNTLGYVGNGIGISAFEISKEDRTPAPFSAPLDEAAYWALNILSERPKNLLQNVSKILDATTEVNVSEVLDLVRDDTYGDILNSTDLRRNFALKTYNLDNIPGIKPAEIRVFGPQVQGKQPDEIDIFNSLATTNLELRLIEKAGCSDASTANPIGHILKAKAQHYLGSTSAARSFTDLRTIADVPDIGEGVLEGHLAIQKILKMSQKRDAQQFKIWFHKECKGDTLQVAKEYGALLREIPKVQSLPIKVIRFVITNAAGLIPGVGPIFGASLGALDSFFVDTWLRGKSPKYFIEDLRQITK